MKKVRLVLGLGALLALAACGTSNDEEESDKGGDTYVDNHYHYDAPTGTSTGKTDPDSPTVVGGGSTSAPSGNTPVVTGGGSPTMTPPTTGTVVTTAPFRAPSCQQLEFASVYNQSSLCGEVLGTLPNIDWWWGKYVTDDDKDGFLEYRHPGGLPNGEYAVTLIDRECGGERSQWANLDYWNIGSCGNIAKLAPADKAFLYCDWWNPSTGTTVAAPDNSPSCEVRFAVLNGCTVVARGNMVNYTGTGCQGL